MHALRTLLAGAGISFVVVLSATVPAAAADNVTALPQPVRMSARSVVDEPWSSPSFPVRCGMANAQVSCTPDDPTEVSAQQCFLHVLIDEADSTVCTTYDGHVQAIKDAGGKPVFVQYGCSLGDLVCVTFENAGRGMALSSTGMMFAVAQNMRFDTSSVLWSAATKEWSFWQWAILVVLFGAMVWAIAAAVVSGDRQELVGAIVRSFIAIPAVPITLWLTGHLLNAIDDMTWYILNREGPASLFFTLQNVMWAGGQANYFFAFLIHGMLMIGMLLLMLVFTFRNIVLAALIAVGPVAWMVFPVRGLGPQWVVRYISALVVLLLTGPLTIGFVTLIINGLATVRTIWDPQSWPLLAGLVLVAFAPFAIFGLFSFVGSVAADGIGSRLGSGAGRAASHVGRSAMSIPTRFGASPAGIINGNRSSAMAGTGGALSRPPGGSLVRGASAPATLGGGATPSPVSTTPAHAAPLRPPSTERKTS